MAAAAGVELTGWEDEFLGSVADRVQTYGRAFADPEKGAQGAALSARQALKLKQIAQKAKGAGREGLNGDTGQAEGSHHRRARISRPQ